MATFPTAAILIRALNRDFPDMEAFPAHKMSSRLGVYVANGLAHVSGPVVMVRSNPLYNPAGNADAASELRAALVYAGYQVKPAKKSLDTEVEVIFVPSKSQVCQ